MAHLSARDDSWDSLFYESPLMASDSLPFCVSGLSYFTSGICIVPLPRLDSTSL